MKTTTLGPSGIRCSAIGLGTWAMGGWMWGGGDNVGATLAIQASLDAGVTLIDTAGAYPGVGAEERGQAEAIARSTEMCLKVKVPIISVIIGEGGSGGAIAIATGNRVCMLEHSIYSVISPEGAASILWRDSTKAKDAATSMRITAEDLKELGIIDGIIPEPVGGAHREPAQAMAATGSVIADALQDLSALDGAALVKDRREKYLAIGRQQH